MQTWSEMITYQAGRRPDNTFLADVLGKVRKGLLRDRTWASAGLPT